MVFKFARNSRLIETFYFLTKREAYSFINDKDWC